MHMHRYWCVYVLGKTGDHLAMIMGKRVPEVYINTENSGFQRMKAAEATQGS